MSVPTFRPGSSRWQSNYFHNLDVTASATYSSADSDFLNFSEFMHGSTATLNTGSPNTRRVSANADLGATYHITKHLSISDKFRWLNWREPGNFTNTAFNCYLPTTTPATAIAGPTGFPAGAVTLTPLRGPCNSDILALTGLTTSGNAPTNQNYEQITAYNSLLGERSYFNTAKLNWQQSRYFSAYVGYRYGRRELRTGDLGVGVFNQVTTTFANTGTGAVPTTPTVATTTGTVESEKINMHTALFGTVLRPTEGWRINGDLEFLYADNSFTNISPRHQQRARVYSKIKVNPWMSVNGGVHFVETRNDYAPGETVENLSGISAGTAGTPLFPTTGVASPAYGNKNHWRYYTLGMSLNPNSKLTFDLGWTLLDQRYRGEYLYADIGHDRNAGGIFSGTGITAPIGCNNVLPPASTARNLLLDYQENTNSGYANISYQPVKRVTLNVGYEITGDNGHTNWLRADNGNPGPGGG